MKVVVILSGGLDSAVLLYYLKQEHQVQALTVDYGQRHQRELHAAQAICQQAQVEHTVVHLSGLAPLLAGSLLVGAGGVIPQGPYSQENIVLTQVPNRNMLLLSLALSYAITLEYDAVAFGAHGQQEEANYPDCSVVFARAMDEVAQHCHSKPLRVLAPFVSYAKAYIVRMGKDLGAPFALTYSCYRGGEKHCGRCSTCHDRKQAFAQAGVLDPTPYEE